MKKILRVESLSLQSKNDEMRKVILSLYEQLLNGLQVPVQIICKSDDYDINNYSINDSSLYKYIKDYSEKHDIVNKTFYMVFEGSKSSVQSTVFTVEQSLKSMNINYNEIDEYKNRYDWNNVELFNSNYIKDEKYFYKTIYINDFPNYCTPGWMEFLYNTPMNIDINCFINPQNTGKSIKFLKRKLIQYNVGTEFECDRSGDDNVFLNELESVEYMLDELRSNSGKMFFVSYYITIKGKTKDELNYNYLMTKNWLESKSITTSNCLLFQHKAYKNNQMTGKDSLQKYYNFVSSTLKCFFPFLSLNICDKKGVFIGTNEENKNLIFLDIFARQYAVMLIMGIMGSGKSFLAKNLIKNLADSGVEITLLDKSGEYSVLNNHKNIHIHSRKTFKEYSIITKHYIEKINDDYNHNRRIPRLFLTDELWSYIEDNEFAEEFNVMFSEMILEGRKKYLAVCFMSQLIESLANNKVGQTIMKTANIKFLMKMNYNESKLIADEFDLNEQQKNFLITAEHEGLLMVNSNCIKFKVQTTEDREELFNTNPYKEAL